MAAEKNRKWKDALLSSGLPLEYLVAEKLAQNDFFVAGEYPYIRQDEQGINTEFSVDLLATLSLDHDQHGHWANLDLLAECKYRRCGTRWIFSPHPSSNHSNANLINVNQDLCTRRITYEDLSAIYSDAQHCVRGIELQEGIRRANPRDISKGLSQLRYAVPNLIKQGLSHQTNAMNDEDLYIQIVCPILVTTASLYVLDRNRYLEDYYKASDLKDVAEEVDTLVVSQRPGPQLEDYCMELFGNFLRDNSTTERYMKTLGEKLRDAGWHTSIIPDVRKLTFTVVFSGGLILVMNYSALDKRLSELQQIISASGNTLKRYATLKRQTITTERGEPYQVFFNDV